MDWLLRLSETWFDLQFRSLIFSAFVIWAALGTGLRSPVWKCSVLAMGSWLMLLMPAFVLFLPSVELPVLSSDSSIAGLDNLQLEHLNSILFITALLFGGFFIFRISSAAIAFIQLKNSLVEAMDLQPLFDECIAIVQPGSKVQCYRSKYAHLPLTFGFYKHSVVLPIDSDQWSEIDLRVCLIHELWHVKRGDWFTQQISALMQFFNLLNPLAWKLNRQLSCKMEESVDKLCVQSGIDARDYAAVLLNQTRAVKDRSGLFSPTFFGEHRYGHSSLQQRIGSLVYEPFGWEPVSITKLLPAALLLLLAAIGIAIFKPGELIVSDSDDSAVTWTYQTYVAHEQPIQTDVNHWRSLQLPIFVQSETSINQITGVEGFIDTGSELERLYDIDPSVPVAPDLYVPQKVDIDDLQIPVKPKPVYMIKPNFPRREAERNREGWVELAFDLDSFGRPISPIVSGGSGSVYFERAALAALKDSLFDLNFEYPGELITRDLTQTYVFELKSSTGPP